MLVLLYFDYDDHGVQAGCDDFDKLYGFGDHDGNVSLMLMDIFAVGMMVVMLVSLYIVFTDFWQKIC